MIKRRLPILAVAAGIFAVLVFGAGRVGNHSAAADKLPVTASFYPLYFFAHEIGGDHTEVSTVVPAGVEPHDYEPTPRDIVRIGQSRLVILNGVGIEPWSLHLQSMINPERTVIIEAAEGRATYEMEEDGKEIADPHLWLSPVLAGRITDAILRGFVIADPAHRAEYEANAAVLKMRLTDLDREYREGLAFCKRRDFITSHAAFGYLAAEYDLNQVSLAGISPEEEPSPAALASIARFARERNIKYIFFESLVSPKLSETIAHEVGAATLVLDPVEGLAAEDAGRGGNYFTKMRENLAHLQRALQCTP